MATYANEEFSSGPFTDCDICQKIWQLFVDSDSPQSIHFDSAIFSDCSRHKPLVSILQESHGSLSRQEWMLGSVEGFRISSTNIVMNYVPVVSSFSSVHLLLSKQSERFHPGIGRLLDHEWIDMGVVPRWKNKCLTSHGDRCANPLKVWNKRPAWLIDIFQGCLVPGKEGGDYVALSYMQGNAPGPQITKDDMELLRTPNGIHDLSKLLSPVIRHAIFITKLLKCRWLWADSLCIDHNDWAETVIELGQMSAIYANAFVTIIAANGDAEDGITGIKDISGSRELNQRVVPFGDEQLLVLDKDVLSGGYFDLKENTSYYRRGWTFQEHLMSKRKLIFNGNSMYWKCQCGEWNEEAPFPPDAPEYRQLAKYHLDGIFPNFPNLEALSPMFNKYNQLNLTYEEDALHGISGILSILSRVFTGGFLYATPEMFLERAICWHTTNDVYRRVEKSCDTARNVLPFVEIPSWSWVGYKGGVWLGIESLRVEASAERNEETISITNWYTGKSPTTPLSDRRKIQSNRFPDREHWKDLNNPLPSGWSRHPANMIEWSQYEHGYRTNGNPWADGSADYVYQHWKAPDQVWYYPFPFPEIQVSTMPFMPEQTPYLFCKTQTIRLTALRRPFERPSSDTTIVLDLASEACDRVGLLYLHNKEQLQYFPATGDGPTRQIDLVAICRVRQTHSDEVLEFYRVLWVEWKGIVAYRLGSGLVFKEEWEKLNLDDIELVLG